MGALEDILVPLGICVALPVLIVWLVMRKRTNDTNRRTEIALAAIEKNPDIDVREFLSKLNPPRKSLQEKLVGKLHYACLFIAVGLGLGIYALWSSYKCSEIPGQFCDILYLFALLSLLIGIAYLLVFFFSRKMLMQERQEESLRSVK